MANPTEEWPSNTVIDALNDTTDDDTGLPYVAKGTKPSSSPTLIRQIDRRLHRQNQVLAENSAGRVVKVDDTHFGVFATHFRLNGADYEYPGQASVAITETDDVYFVYLDADSDDGGSGDVTVVTDATGWPDDPSSFIPLAEITVASEIIDSIEDVRNRARLSGHETTPNDKTTSAADSLAIPVTHAIVEKTTGGDAEALSLADGRPGQILTIVLSVDGGGDGTLTSDTTFTGWATIVFADAGDTATLRYVDDTVGWVILGTAGVVAPPVISI